jgi:hypothetical protein
MIHVAPIDDLQEHVLDLDCDCGANQEWIDPETGLPYQEGPLVVHASFDGRENLPNGKKWGVYKT